MKIASWQFHIDSRAMNTLRFRTLLVMLSIRRTVGAFSDLSTCHDDFSLKPSDGILKKNTFGWLGFLQYCQVITGLPHLTKAPRVLLIHKQFVVGTAVDLLILPKNYKLGSVIFGEYDREEEDCDMTRNEMKKGSRCPYAYYETSILDIIPHPEYPRFGVENSLALGKLLQPIKSRYMMPICMPSLTERTRKKKNKLVFMVDYTSTLPKDFDVERMGKKTLKLYTHIECRAHRQKKRLGNEGISHVLCSTGCGVRPGAPIVSQNVEGAFELIGVSIGSALCQSKSMRRRLTRKPPLYIDVYPYTTWITNVITAHELPLPYPQSFRLIEGGANIGIHKDFLRKRRPQRAGWRGRTFVTGDYCYRIRKQQKPKRFVLFYSEVFLVRAEVQTRMTVDLKISAGIECTIVCARLLLPSRLSKPRIAGIGGYNISVSFTTEWYPHEFIYTLGLIGKNTTRMDYETWLPEFSDK